MYLILTIIFWLFRSWEIKVCHLWTVVLPEIIRKWKWNFVSTQRTCHTVTFHVGVGPFSYWFTGVIFRFCFVYAPLDYLNLDYHSLTEFLFRFCFVYAPFDYLNLDYHSLTEFLFRFCFVYAPLDYLAVLWNLRPLHVPILFRLTSACEITQYFWLRHSHHTQHPLPHHVPLTLSQLP